MKLELPSLIAKQAPAALFSAGCASVAEAIKDQIGRYGNPDNIEVGVMDLGIVGLSALYDLAKSAGDRSLMMQITSHRNVIESPFSAMVSSLKALPSGLIAFMTKDSIDGWLYRKEDDGVFLPWLVREIKFQPANQHSPACVIIRMSANTAKTVDRQREQDVSRDYISIQADAIVKKSVPEILAARGYYHETQEFKESYKADLADFAKYRQQFGAQFSANGAGIIGENRRVKVVGLSQGDRLINDEEAISRLIVEQVDGSFWERQAGCPVFQKQPYHCRLHMFHLGLHKNQWVHVSALKPYEYNPGLREKLILPTLHRDIIDILTTDMGIIMEDVVCGKSGGTTILCKGGPGLGKTLTAEITAEIVKKPLYRIHSGQLGVNADSVEKNLGDILKRAARWGAILLLDEADVFIRRRDNDIQHNAVVAAFLRTLEYFSGTLFLTTNRSEDIDDAILSRCIAIINYTTPSPADAKRLWKMLSKQFEINLSDALIKRLVSLFKTASGRDIKELLKLSSKFARSKGVPLDIEIFRQCATFRGIL